jgi:hypothetical protein
VNARVAYIGPVPPLTGGIAQHGAQVIEALRGVGADVTVLSWPSQYPSLLYKGARKDPSLKATRDVRSPLRWSDPVSWLRAGRIASRSDLVVVPWVTPIHAVAYRTMLAVARVPASVIVHNALPHEELPCDAQLARWVLSNPTPW